MTQIDRSTNPRRILAVASIAMALFVVALAPAGAAAQGAPEFRERYSFIEEAHADLFSSELCGVEIYHETAGKGTVKFYEDGLIVDHFNFTTTIWNPATGDTIIRKEAATFRGRGEEVFDPAAQTLTISFEDHFTGLPSMFYKPGEGLLWRDAGQAMFAGTVVLDVSGPEPELVSIEETVTLKGPHPELTTDGAELQAIYCGALGA